MEWPEFKALEALQAEQRALCERLLQGYQQELPEIEEACDTVRQGRAVIDDYPPDMDPVLAKTLFLEMARLLGRRTGDPVGVAQIERLIEHVGGAEIGIHEITSEVLPSELLPLARLLMSWSLRPFLAPIAEKLRGHLDGRVYVGANCPVCGALPFLALEPATDFPEQMLEHFCPDCTGQWLAPAGDCAFCRTDNPEQLHTIDATGSVRYRLGYCSACRHYLKRVCESVEEPLRDPFLEDIRSLPLDLAARQHQLLPMNPQLGGI